MEEPLARSPLGTRRHAAPTQAHGTPGVGAVLPASLAAPPRSVRGVMILTPSAVHSLQRLAGNSAVATAMCSASGPCASPPVIQREFEDQGQVGEGELGPSGAVSQPDLGESGGGGGELMAESVNDFGEMDGVLTTGTEVHAFVNKGQVATGRWHHCGGTGGKGNENTGTSTVVAPVYESAPPAKGGQAKAWVRKGTGTVKVKRSWNGVVPGNNGTAVWSGSGGGLVFLRASAVSRMGKHEAGHVKETKKIHDSDIKPLEKRVKARKTGGTEAAAVSALQTHVDWNATLTGFASKDTAVNAPGATFDTTDQAKANFYHDKGPKTIKTVAYGHLIEAP